MTPPKKNVGFDSISWKEVDDGSFSVKPAYEIACQSQSIPKMKLFKLIHKWSGLKWIRSSLWKLDH